MDPGSKDPGRGEWIMNEDNLNDMTIDDIYELINWEIVSKDLYIRFVEGNYESDDKEKLIQILLDQQ